MTAFPRRVLLRRGGMVMVGFGLAPGFLPRVVAAQTRRPRVLVVVFQRGAVDGLNMVVPYGEPDYHLARPSIAIPAPGTGDAAAIPIDDFFGLHPRMAPLAPLARDGRLGVVHACGTPLSTRSHFDAQDYLESGTPGVKRTTDGWLNRYLGTRPAPDATPFRGVAMTPRRPRILQGAAGTLVIPDLNRFGLRAGPGSDLGRALRTRYREAADAVLGEAAREAFEAVDLLEAEGVREGGERADGYPAGRFGRALRQIARLIAADVGVEVAFAESDGWDHHVDEAGQIAGRLDELARGIAAFHADLGHRMEEVLLVTVSEFGRSVAENGGRGTDHGHGNAMLLVGGGVQGGAVRGRWPGLRPEQRFEGRDLAVTTDVRDLLGEVLVRHLGLSPAAAAAVFPGYEIAPARFPGVLG